MNTPQDYKYDVFISYRSTDKKWVRGELLETLEAAGLKVCIDYRDFKIGDPTVEEIERAVQESRKTLLVLTPAYWQSGWTEYENLILQTLEFSNRQRRLIPLVKEKCALPPRISYLNHANFVNPDDLKAEWGRLLTALGKSNQLAVLKTLVQPDLPKVMTNEEVVTPALAMARRSLAILEEQAAGFGKLQMPAHLRIELEEKRLEVAALEARLRNGTNNG